ncbi:thiopurine S-methyltransferase [Beggiatoa leptomitoformis]|uniref:Thiopurine S-methyltransferase n=1 Tax=Beggiatoa leptomitoformis TaxID=288004 RepID=A0A2N9YBN2_9GAMM|nr:thiopurine S-methyltransferase [Beggiatoa leptomitoformis]ALG66788.1 thiopurine S-methyltransferase [Beggiatoa leptomitoformis]AUI67866.1 thiopurine S-methyltransferase [Beggiatoa leptomitoformis]
MNAEFWHKRWERNQIGFHQTEINTHLQTYWQALNLPKGASVFVPLCGKSLDMLWLLEQGYRVLGIELSKVAVRDFFTENNLTPTVTTYKTFNRWAMDEIEILCGDFFHLTPTELQTCTAIYDRASLVALPPEMRNDYAQQLATLFPTNTQILLVTFEYSQAEMQGPPFAVHADEVTQLYQQHFTIEQVAHTDILNENPRFQKLGVTQMQESVYLLRKK